MLWPVSMSISRISAEIICTKQRAKYVNTYGTIIIEDLRPANMVKNRHLARAIMDSSWGMLRDLIEVKAESAGRTVIVVPPHYTSQK